jgi:hypothetical protein
MNPEIHPQYLPKIVKNSNNIVGNAVKKLERLFEWRIQNLKDVSNILKIQL